MYSGDFFTAIEELTKNRGVKITWIAKALGISRRYLYYLINNQKLPGPRLLQRADVALPELFSKKYRLKRPGVYFLEDSEDTVTAPTPAPIQDQRREYRILWERPPGVHLQPIDDREIRLRIKEEKERQARERDRVWLERLRSVWWGRK